MLGSGVVFHVPSGGGVPPAMSHESGGPPASFPPPPASPPARASSLASARASARALDPLLAPLEPLEEEALLELGDLPLDEELEVVLDGASVPPSAAGSPSAGSWQAANPAAGMRARTAATTDQGRERIRMSASPLRLHHTRLPSHDRPIQWVRVATTPSPVIHAGWVVVSPASGKRSQTC